MHGKPSIETAILRALDRHFATGQPAWRFAVKVLLVSLAGLLPAVALYVVLSPGMGAHVLAGGAAGGRFLRQILTNGLPVVFAVNFASFLLYARLRAGGADPLRMVGLDLVARVGLFLALHALVFWGSALAFGSFGGDPVQALRVVAPTLVQAAAFGNLSGAYLYATILGALPLHIAVLARLTDRSSGPGAGIALGLLGFALQAAVLTALAALIIALQGR
jgi:hypothetical protein